MSAFGGKADIVIAKCPRPKSGFVRYCPKADIVSAFCGDPGAASLILGRSGTRSTSNKITQKGLAFSFNQSGTVSSSGRGLRFGILPCRLLR